jgi:hypothetical protein
MGAGIQPTGLSRSCLVMGHLTSFLFAFLGRRANQIVPARPVRALDPHLLDGPSLKVV